MRLCVPGMSVVWVWVCSHETLRHVLNSRFPVGDGSYEIPRLILNSRFPVGDVTAYTKPAVSYSTRGFPQVTMRLGVPDMSVGG
jgi:hypothetical protein